MTTIATLFSGGEGVGTGARQAGLTHLWGIEYDDDIANVARMNGFDVITADVMSIDPYTLPVPDVLHVSPVCKNASIANNQVGESPSDLATADKVCQFINIMMPKIFTLENVYPYRHFDSFGRICTALSGNGYMWDFDNLNAADFGVPQTRRRLILRAKRGALLPNLPQPVKWVSWYEAIENLLANTVPVYAQWLKKRIEPYQITAPVLVDAVNTSREPTILNQCEPAMTMTLNFSRRPSHMPSVWTSNKSGKHINVLAVRRLQSFPDTYRLPETYKLACDVTSNAVPPKLYKSIIEGLTQ